MIALLYNITLVLGLIFIHKKYLGQKGRVILKIYQNEEEFFRATERFPSIGAGYLRVRNKNSVLFPFEDLMLVCPSVPKDFPLSAFKVTTKLIYWSVLESIPVVGAFFFSIGRLFAMWCIEDFPGSIFSRIYHTIVGVLGILGLGIIMFILRIIFTLLTLPFWLISCLKSSAA
ncbi:hypothetical protein CpB0859 [Chlamydia pneumoniae TW-183]|uniref:Uncharacterized protein n=3 Tax=Chlamydia pneumoniae TaxID=83558 RepID=A0A0F7XP21_CHLPN|nr:hypothetical protein CPn_0830 [Chlamydia pneumoniae CWL029]AAP98788.1 hypothetical protein CpB0859 [Chlamydia pneumoniae TW-183]CRI37339.1 Putative uncharacterized protein CPn0830 [Chlamydia pneumoniae]CRI38468.1 Putative uncharacterized protein CPn0830 [Chlamydia pneumoniae]CRI39600.1 Putative uncharacterized protein CPn0830 [Chlamydia pneumoniae]